MARQSAVLVVVLAALVVTSVAHAQESQRRTRTVRITAPDGTGVPGVWIRSSKGKSVAISEIDGVVEIHDGADADLVVLFGGDLRAIAADDD